MKILDFGIARLAILPDIVKSGSFCGTPLYMSPEQFNRFSEVDNKSDIYSLGIVLYELLSGRLPFYGNVDELRDAHITRSPQPISILYPAIPKQLDGLILDMLDKNPENRPLLYEIKETLKSLISTISQELSS